jgi:hypothetical protein
MVRNDLALITTWYPTKGSTRSSVYDLNLRRWIEEFPIFDACVFVTDFDRGELLLWQAHKQRLKMVRISPLAREFPLINKFAENVIGVLERLSDLERALVVAKLGGFRCGQLTIQ